MNLFVTIIEMFKLRVNLGLVVTVMLLCYNIEQVEAIKGKVESMNIIATTAYPYNVIKYGLKGSDSEADIYATIRKWREDDWGAQIGAMQTLCEKNPKRLGILMNKDTLRRACRISN